MRIGKCRECGRELKQSKNNILKLFGVKFCWRCLEFKNRENKQI